MSETIYDVGPINVEVGGTSGDYTVSAIDVDILLKVENNEEVYSWVPTHSFVGDMFKSDYDSDESGVVDDAKRLGGFMPSNYSTTASINGHVNDYDNPHKVTKTQVGNTISQWNANKIQGINVSTKSPTNGNTLQFVSSASQWVPSSVNKKQIIYHPCEEGGEVITWLPEKQYKYKVTLIGAQVGDAVIVSCDKSIWKNANTTNASINFNAYVSEKNIIKILVNVTQSISLALEDSIRITVV